MLKDKLQLISEENRLGFLPHFFENDFIVFESTLYKLMEANSEDYTGGYYDYYLTDNGAPMILLAEEGDFHVAVESNYFFGKMDIGIYSAATMTLATNLMSWRAYENNDEVASAKYTKYYYDQRNWAERVLSQDEFNLYSQFLD